MKRGKKWRSMVEKVDREKIYEIEEAVKLVKETSYTKFEGTVEASIKVNYKSLQNIRGIISLPNGTGKEVRVLVFCREDKQAAAKEAGADYVGGIELVEKIQQESWTDFDACVATPDMMKDVGKLGPILGRKGLMPKPKAGTVTPDVATAVQKLKAGQMEYKPDKTGVIHLRVGKTGFDDVKLAENVKALYGALMRDKPADAKGDFLKSFCISPTMGPGIKLNMRSLG
ncbi:MAG: 50S ribosomal protein L1 [Leptospiraceae bacterium]|nr:50S ribosomal protein L1 [Leptospiraceae bacterium]